MKQAAVVAASAGGLAALRVLLAALPPSLRSPVIIVLHTAAPEAGPLIEVLAPSCRLPLVVAAPRLSATGGHVWLAPPGYHLLVETDLSFSLSAEPRVRYSRPSADVLFESAADAWRDRLVGMVLTGANDDGARGLAAIRSRGGYALVQAPEEAEFSEMPRAALEQAGADEVLPLASLAARLPELLA